MNQRAQSRHENAGFLDPTSTLDAVNYLGKLYAAQGKYADANEMYWRALDGKEKAWGPDHPCTLETVNNLGALYTDQGKHAEAETMYQRALDGYKRYWDLDHPSTLHTTSNLQDLDRSEDRSKSKTRNENTLPKNFLKTVGPRTLLASLLNRTTNLKYGHIHASAVPQTFERSVINPARVTMVELLTQVAAPEKWSALQQK
ncbi:MAG: hypothetical protein LQ351_006445 [Letrouitia transgressa]|nr:MAG: hypothetical protein LQ351_006445 [Letrouitia transgressa]